MAWLVGWGFRKEITVQDTNVDSNLTNLPALVFLNADADFHEARADGYDIRFTSSDGQTLLPYERESWSGGSGGAATAHFWVKVPSILATGGATIYIYYGKADAADGEDAQNVWDANFKARYSMKDLTTSTIEDSTANNNDGTKKAANEPTEADGKIAKAQDFDGIDDYVIKSAPTGLPTGNNPITLEAWFKVPSAFTTVGYFILSGIRGTRSGYHILINHPAAGKLFSGYFDVGFEIGVTGMNDGQWHHFVGTYDGSIHRTYVDSIAKNTLNEPGTGALSGAQLILGVSTPNFERLDGIVDEARISNIARSAEWIKFEYYNVNEADNELTWGAEEVFFTIADALHGHSTDAIALTQLHNLLVADALHGHLADSPALTQAHLLAIAGDILNHVTDPIVLSQVHNLLVNGGLHNHIVDPIILAQIHQLIINNILHGHTSDSITLSQIHNLLVESAEHSHLADLIALFQAHQLAVNDGLHSHLADSVDIISTILLSLQSILRANELFIGRLGYSPDQPLKSALNTHKTIHTRIRRSS